MAVAEAAGQEALASEDLIAQLEELRQEFTRGGVPHSCEQPGNHRCRLSGGDHSGPHQLGEPTFAIRIYHRATCIGMHVGS